MSYEHKDLPERILISADAPSGCCVRFATGNGDVDAIYIRADESETAIAEAVIVEREECALIAERYYQWIEETGATPDDIAAAIRARSEEGAS